MKAVKFYLKDLLENLILPQSFAWFILGCVLVLLSFLLKECS